MASYLKRQGYATGCVGKWHLGWEWPRTGPDETAIEFTRPIANGPTSCGFDYFFGIAGSLDMAPYVYVENDRPTAIPDRHCQEHQKKDYEFYRAGPVAPDFQHEDVLDTLQAKAVEYIDTQAQQDSPFFLYFPLTAPHTPILPGEAFRGKSGTNVYGDFCVHVDHVVGQIDAALQRNGQAENTIFIFTADNGCSRTANYEVLAEFGHNPSYIFRGHKADIYEGGHRIPLVIRWPEQITAGSACDDVVCLADLLATMAEICGQPLADSAGEDSVSNLPAWLGQGSETPLREATVHHSINGSFSIRQGKWKLEFCPGSGGWSDPKPGEEPEGAPAIQLYDLTKDIGEQDNIQDAHGDVIEQLTALMTQYVKTGRSTPGAPQSNTGPKYWPQLNWMLESDLQ